MPECKEKAPCEVRLNGSHSVACYLHKGVEA
jgi:hypothetical protein